MTTQPAEVLSPADVEAILDDTIAALDMAERTVVNRTALAVALGLPTGLDPAELADALEENVPTQPYLADADEHELAASIARHPAGKRAGERPALHAVPAEVVDEAPQPFEPAVPLERSEVKVTSATGGTKGMKEARLDLVPAGPLWELAVLYGRGQMKYPDAVDGAPNWKRGYSWSLGYSAMVRHANLFWMGEDHDPEMAVKHLIAVAWHALNLAWFMENRPQFDDRPTSVQGERYEGALPTPQWLKDKVAQREAEKAADEAAIAKHERKQAKKAAKKRRRAERDARQLAEAQA